MNTTTRHEISDALDKNSKITLVEVHSQEDYDKGHIQGAVLMAKDDVKKLAPSLLSDKEARIVVYGPGNGNRVSSEVCGQLSTLGYKNVSDYKEGKADWVAAGRPVVTTAPPQK